MKEVFDAINSRIKAPYFGYSLIAFFALNWRGIFLLILTKGTPEEKLLQFDEHTSLLTLLVFPLIIGAVIAASSHWFRYFFGIIERKPRELFDSLILEAEHKNTVKQTELEQSRNQLFAIKEEQLIDRAKRDEAVSDIEDSDTKDKLMQELQLLRKERDKLSIDLKNVESSKSKLSTESKDLLRAAAKDKDGLIKKPKTLGERAIHAGRTSFGNGDQRIYARYEAAIKELLKYEHIQEVGSKGEIFELTNVGWEAAEAL